jgi:hypothetical protein
MELVPMALSTTHRSSGMNIFMHKAIEPLRFDDFEHLDRWAESAATGLGRRDLRHGAIRIATELLMRWRTPFPQLLADLADCVADRQGSAQEALRVWAALAAADPLPDFAQIVPLLSQVLTSRRRFAEDSGLPAAAKDAELRRSARLVLGAG